MSKYLITRFGGIGDVAPVGVAAYQLHKRGHEVTLALREEGPIRQTDLYNNQDWLTLMDYRQIGPWGSRCVKYKHGWKQIESIYQNYDIVVDMMFSIEANSTCKSGFAKKPNDCWERTRNSNWINWYDLNLMWVNIDPTSVSDEEKRPLFTLTGNEQKMVEDLRKGGSHVFTLNPIASSLARTWYQSQDVIKMIMDKYENPLVIVWNPSENKWMYHSKGGAVNVAVTLPSGLRQSMVLIAASDLYIGVDTGMSHIAEGLQKKHIAIYSTVPWWTRAKYYKYQTPIDMGVEHPEFYTFSLSAGDPLNIEEGFEGMSKREKRMLELHDKKANINDVCREFNSDHLGMRLEVEALQKKMQSFERIQSKSLSMVTPEMVFNKVVELCA